jgi:hypothetical protein
LGAHNRIFGFKEQPPGPNDRIHDSLALLTTPQGFSFQHFSDHAYKPLLQSEHLIDQDTDVLAMKRGTPEPSVKELWGMFSQINSSRVVFGPWSTRWAKVRVSGLEA